MAAKQDFALFAGLVVFGFCVTQVVHKQLAAFRKACEISSTKPSEDIHPQPTKDALKLETLDELSRNVNDEIRNAVVEIVTERASKSQACHLLLRELGSKTEECRNRALTTVLYLHDSSAALLSTNETAVLTAPVPRCFDVYKYTALQSIIDCLSHQLPLSHRYETARKEGKTFYRTQAECDALELLGRVLVQYGAPLAIECNILSLWLARYPFGADYEAEYPDNKAFQLARKQGDVHRLTLSQNHDPAMSQIIMAIMRSDEGREKIVECELFRRYGGHQGLYDGTDGSDDDKDGYAQIWYEVHGINTAPDPGLGPMMRRNPRPRDESLEEQVLRRRRREAMVLGEMGRPIEREDIFQRVDT